MVGAIGFEPINHSAYNNLRDSGAIQKTAMEAKGTIIGHGLDTANPCGLPISLSFLPGIEFLLDLTNSLWKKELFGGRLNDDSCSGSQLYRTVTDDVLDANGDVVSRMGRTRGSSSALPRKDKFCRSASFMSRFVLSFFEPEFGPYQSTMAGIGGIM